MQWIDVFTRPVYKDIVVECLEYCQNEKGLELFAWCIMTNHVHLLARAKDGFLLQDILRDFKKFTSKKILSERDNNKKESRKEWLQMIFEYHAKFNKRVGEVQFWSHENHAIEMFDYTILESKIEYIHMNPVRAGWVENAEDYLYSSARNYAEIKGLLEIELAI